MMKVFKFGGASVKSADAVKNVAKILNKYKGEKIVVVVSAMGKMTNAFECLVNSYYNDEGHTSEHLNKIFHYHEIIMHDLFNKDDVVFSEIEILFKELASKIVKNPQPDYDYVYDQIVPYGELLSSAIIYRYLNNTGISCELIDAKEIIKTNKQFREAKIDWSYSTKKTKTIFEKTDDSNGILFITQGFIGSTMDNIPTTLGREGSDFTAAALAYMLDAEEVIVWKDVPGLLNADPKLFNNPEKIDTISYREAIELAYYGAKVIHPKTIKPLQNKNIPLRLKSFIDPDSEGSLIHKAHVGDSIIPSYIFKLQQVLISISPKDFSFVVEENLSFIFGLFARFRIKANLMQNSAISFSVCIDNEKDKVKLLLEALKTDYNIRYNEKMQLISIRHYTDEIIDKITTNRKVYLEQKSRSMIQLVVRP